MAEIEYKGIKVGGSKLLLVLPLLGTIIGGLWGGFELYSRYQQMETKINNYVAPDMSGFDKALEVQKEKFDMLKSELDMVLQEVQIVADVAKELKNDLRADVRRIEKIVEDVEQRVKEDSRTFNQDLKFALSDIKDRMKELEERTADKIQKALENPLANMRKN